MSPPGTEPALSPGLALTVRELGKCYHIYDRPADRLRQALLGRFGRSYYTAKWALRDISFDLERGMPMGIVGRNGAGKSTLLQIIAGTLAPTTGRVVAAGRVVALLELGSGFNAEFTGRENVFLYGALYGLTRHQMEARFDPIAAFADIGPYMDQPLKTYSTGMGVRLAFAVIAHLDPDILIVDEALAVGDVFFQHKCMRHIGRLIDGGATLLFVSHGPDVVKRLCRRSLWLDEGRAAAFGDASTVVERYLADMRMELAAVAAPAEPAEAAPPPALPPPDGLPLCERPTPDPALVCQGSGTVREFQCGDHVQPALALQGAGDVIGFRLRADEIELVFGAHSFSGRAFIVVDGVSQVLNLYAAVPRRVRVPVKCPGRDAIHTIFIGSEGADPRGQGREIWFLEGITAEGESAAVAVKRSAAFDRRAADGRYGTGDATITLAELLAADDMLPVDEVASGTKVALRVHASLHAPCPLLDVSFIVRDRNGIDCFGTTAYEQGLSIPGAPGARLIDFTFRNPLGPGSYSIHVALVARDLDPTRMTPLDVVQIAAVFTVPFDAHHPIWYLFDEPVQVTTIGSDADVTVARATSG